MHGQAMLYRWAALLVESYGDEAILVATARWRSRAISNDSKAAEAWQLIIEEIERRQATLH